MVMFSKLQFATANPSPQTKFKNDFLITVTCRLAKYECELNHMILS